jgi:Ca2+-transporting ATPase
MQIEEAALTGESVPANKLIAQLNGQQNDECRWATAATWPIWAPPSYTDAARPSSLRPAWPPEMGKIAGALSQAEDGETPLQKKLGQLSKVLSVTVLAICAFIFAFQHDPERQLHRRDGA